MTTPTRVPPMGRSAAASPLLPDPIDRGLAADDRLTYYVTLLKMAAVHAQQPNVSMSNLHDAREANGVEDQSFDEIVEGSRSLAPELYLIPRASRVVELMVADLREMADALSAAARNNPEFTDRLTAYMERVAGRIAGMPRFDDDRVSAREIDALTRRANNGDDTLHQLVLDIRWEFNRLQASTLEEVIDGARGRGLTPGDRSLIRAFMKGVRETAPLRLDHRAPPAAIRIGDRLSIEHDIGMGASHVVGIHINGSSVTLIYADRRRSRVAFLKYLLEAHHLHWETALGADGTEDEVHIGRYTGERPGEIEAYLTFLGSRLVFLAGWKRARKRLARFVKQADADMLLRWAADNNIGHFAFLSAGDVSLVNAALERAVPAQIRAGVRLDELLGRESACAFLKTVLATAATGVMSHRSLRLIGDEIEAELFTYLETTDEAALAAAAEHATLLSTVCERLHGTLLHIKAEGTTEDAAAAAEAAAAAKRRADEVSRRLDRLIDSTTDRQSLTRLLSEARGVVEIMEQAAFTLTLIPERPDPKCIALLDDLADLARQACRAYLRCIEDARDLRGSSTRQDLERLLVGVDHLAELGDQSRSVERLIEATLLRPPVDFRQMHVLLELARELQLAIESLAGCGLVVHDYVLAARPRSR
jgi:hypothetical protein